MHQTEEVLLVVVFQVRIVVLQGQVFGDLPVSTAVKELVAFFCPAIHSQAISVRRGATCRVFQLTRVKGPAVELLGGDGATFKSLWQQTAIARDQNRQVGL
ncbi:hypothetical protein D3C85_1319410 [compost metagenome]